MLTDNFGDYFNESINKLNARSITKAYISSIFTKYKHSEFDLSNKSLTILYIKAIEKNSFFDFQNIGDWIFICRVYFNGQLQSSIDYYCSLAQNSYSKCYKLTNQQIDVYEELAENFSRLSDETKKLIHRF